MASKTITRKHAALVAAALMDEADGFGCKSFDDYWAVARKRFGLSLKPKPPKKPRCRGRHREDPQTDAQPVVVSVMFPHGCSHQRVDADLCERCRDQLVSFFKTPPEVAVEAEILGRRNRTS